MTSTNWAWREENRNYENKIGSKNNNKPTDSPKLTSNQNKYIMNFWGEFEIETDTAPNPVTLKTHQKV